MKVEGLRKKLLTAEGRSEFIIAVVCDIRGFSEFSKYHESPDTAMFIKRFYLQLLEKYFQEAIFVKPTGDGMLMTFCYTETTLSQVSNYVLSSCFSALADFPKMFADDPMINFETPQNLGFGISRGPACCLHSGKDVIDYSGHVLNLAARLNDIARPEGVVIDGQFLLETISSEFIGNFSSKEVFLKSIAEDKARKVMVSNAVSVPSYACFPLSTDKWQGQKHEMTVAQIMKLTGNFTLTLKDEAKSKDKIKIEFVWPNKKVKGYTTSREYSGIHYFTDAIGPKVRMDISQAKNIITEEKLTSKTIVCFDIQYVPKK